MDKRLEESIGNVRITKGLMKLERGHIMIIGEMNYETRCDKCGTYKKGKLGIGDNLIECPTCHNKYKIKLITELAKD